MKKRTYKSIDVNKVDPSRLAEQVTGEHVVFGVDAGKEKFVGAVMIEGRETAELRIKWVHPIDTAKLVGLITGLPAASLTVALEPSGTYGDPLRNMFLEQGVKVNRICPKRSHDAAEVFDGVPSWHDPKSAVVIARLHMNKASSPWPMRPEKDRDIAAAIRAMAMYDKQEHANINRLEAQLARHWPEILGQLDLTSATLVHLIERYGTPEEVTSAEDAAKKQMRKVGGSLLSQKKIEAVVEGARYTIGVKATKWEKLALQEIAAEILRCRKAGRKFKATVEALTKDNEAARRMSSVVGKVTSAVIVSDAGDPAQYESSRSFLKALGLNLKEKSSGKHKGQLKITKRGPGRCRFYLYLAVLRLIQRDPIFALWYEKKVARDGGKVKNKAIIALMRKLAQGLWHVAQGARFDSRLLFDLHKLGLVKTKVRAAGTKSRAKPERRRGMQDLNTVLDAVFSEI